jgi:hypothetical protein
MMERKVLGANTTHRRRQSTAIIQDKGIARHDYELRVDVNHCHHPIVFFYSINIIDSPSARRAGDARDHHD